MPRPFAFEIRFPHLRPETTSLGVLAELLKAIEQAIIAVAESNGDSDDEDLVFGLVGVQNGSLRLLIGSPNPAKVRTYYKSYAEAVARNRIDSLPEKGQEATKKFASYAQKLKTPVEFRESSNAIPDVIIHPELNLSFRTPLVRGETVLYGIVEKVGGKKPRVRIVLDDGSRVNCRASRSTAQKLGQRLYQRVGLRGFAKWDTADWSIVDFTIIEVLDFEEIPITEAIALLAKASGPEAWPDWPSADPLAAQGEELDDDSLS